MDDRSKTGTGKQQGWPFAWPDMTAAAQSQASSWFQSQSEFAQAAQEMMGAWTKHRQQDFESAVEAMQKIGASRDMGSAAGIYSDWLRGNMDRLQAEIGDVQEEALRLSELGRRSMGVSFGALSSAAASSAGQGDKPKKAAAE